MTAVACFANSTQFGWRQLNHNPISLLSEILLPKLERRAGELALHGRINDAYRRATRISTRGPNLGRDPRRCLADLRGGVFFRRIPHSRVLTNLLGRLGRARGRPYQKRSDLDIPLVDTGLFYGQGYFRQRLDRAGWQREEYLQTDMSQLPMELAIGTGGQKVRVEVETRADLIRAKVWRVKVGRHDLLLLDSSQTGSLAMMHA